MTRSGKLEIETVDRIGAADPAAWDAAVEALRLPVFYSRAFLAAYERYPLTGIDACRYLLVRRGGQIVAVVPAYLQSRPDPLGCLATAYPEASGQPAVLSHVWHCYDTHIGGPAGTADPELASAVMAALRRLARELGAPWCGVVNVCADGPSAAALADAGLPTRHLVDRFARDITGVTDLDHFLASYSRGRAGSNLRRYQRRAAEHGAHSTVLPVEEADLSAVTALCARLADKHGNNEYYPVDRFQRFLPELGPAVRVLEIRQHDRLIATGVSLLDAHSFHSWAGGADYNVDGNFSPYYLMFAETVQLALRLRLPVFEGGRGNHEFKVRHGLVARPLIGCLVPS